MKTNKISTLAVVFLGILGFLNTSYVRAQQVQRTVGFNVQQQLINEQDIIKMKNVGCNVVRLAFSTKPLMNPHKAPFRWYEDNWKRLHQLIGFAQKHKVRVIIDPHAMPLARNRYTTWASDDLYNSEPARQAFIKLWDRIAKECAKYGDVIWAYDLMNEGAPQRGLDMWDQPFNLKDHFYKPAIKAIRKHDDHHNILLEFRSSDFVDGVVKAPSAYGQDLPKSKILFGPHFYWPHSYTHQGRGANPRGQRYPDITKDWTKANMKADQHGMLGSVQEWGNQHGNWRLFVGEFGAIYNAGGAWDLGRPNEDPPRHGGDKWLKDAVSIFNEKGWSYTYHAWDEPKPDYNAQIPKSRWELHKLLIKQFNDPVDTQAPTAPKNLSVTNVTATSAKLSWTGSSDNTGVEGYEIIINNQPTIVVTGTSTDVTWLGCETTYSFKIKAVDLAGNKSGTSNTVTRTTAACMTGPFLGVNHQIPGKIEGEHYDLGGEGMAYHDNGTKQGDQSFRPGDNVDVVAKASASNGRSVGYSNNGEWLAYSVDIQAGKYDIILTYASGAPTQGDLQVSINDNVVGTITNITNSGSWTTFTTTKISNVTLGGGADQTLRLEYVNGGGFDLDAVEFEKTGGGTVDTQGPSKPGNITASNITKTSMDLSWGASNDNVGVTGYEVMQNGSVVKTVNGTSTSISGLDCETQYSFRVVAMDAAGNKSIASNARNVSTDDCGITPPPPPPPSTAYRYLRLTVKSKAKNQVRIGEISWKVGNSTHPTPSITNGTQSRVNSTISQNTDWRAYDGKLGTGAWKPENTFPSSITLDLTAANAIMPTAIVIEPVATDRGPGSFDVHGSNDGSNWTLLHSESGLTRSSYPGKKGTFNIGGASRFADTKSIPAQLSIAPVPCSQGNCDLKIIYHAELSNALYKLFGTDGRLVKAGMVDNNSRAISLNKINTGIYYLSVQLNGEVITRKIAIE